MSRRIVLPDMSQPVGLNWHENFIVHLASILRPNVYMELGLYECAVFNRIIPFAQHLIGVDISPRAKTFMTRSPKTEFICSSTKGLSLELAPRGMQIDMLFIDADHSREAVLEDFRSYSPFVAPHGLILIHDTHPRDTSELNPAFCGDGYLAIPDLQTDLGNFEMVTIPVSPGLTICRKRTSQLSWAPE